MTLSADLRHAVRLFKRSPGFAATSVLVLSLAIGVNTAIFSLVDAVVLKPLPYQDPQRLVMVYEDARKQGDPHLEPAVANFVDWRNQSQTLVNSAAFTWYTYSLTGVDAPQKVEGQRVTASLFAALGVQPFLGTVFSASEEHVGAPDVAVISHGLWQRRFGSDRDLVGKTITLDGRRFTVVGVMPPAFRFPSKNVEIWTPLRLPPDLARNRALHTSLEWSPV